MPVSGGDIIYAIDVNRRVITVTATTNFGSSVTTTETVIDTGSGVVVSGRKYRLKWVFKYAGTVANDRFVIRIREGSTAAGTEIESNVFLLPATGNTFTEILEVDWTAGSSGVQAFAGTVQRISGTGNITPQGTSTSHRSLTADYAD